MIMMDKPPLPDVLFNDTYFAQPIGYGGNYIVDEILHNLHSELHIPYLVVSDPENEIHKKMIEFTKKYAPEAKVSHFVFSIGYYEPFKC